MITRFAPSPTGHMHIGNARTALICWLYARKKSGEFILRIDDTDIERSEDRYIEGLKQDLKWLGIDWDVSFNQRSRTERYDEIFNLLLRREAIYPCYETREELELKRKMLLKMGLPPIYDRSALKMTEKEREACKGRETYFRLKIADDQEISWEDEIRGKVIFQTKNISDPIIKRTDGSYTYIFPSAVDDVDFGITNVVRGEDHISNTAIQIHIMNLLDARIPKFSHLPLLRVEGAKISKRLGSDSIEIRSLRNVGIEPITINSYLSRIGTALPIEVKTDIADLVPGFDISVFNHASINFFPDDLQKLNTKVLQELSFAQVQEKLLLHGVDCSEEFWNMVRSNIDVLSDVKSWVEICNGEITPVVNEEDRELLVLSKARLPDGEFDNNTWQVWFSRIKEGSSRSSKGILLPLRLALTGVQSGPNLGQLLTFIGRKETVRRLECAVKK